MSTGSTARTKPHGAAAVAMLALVVTLVAGLAAPAAAAGGELLVSHDGVNFASDSTLSLFSGMGRVVPGDRSTEQVWVKNDSATDAVLRVDLVDPTADDAALAAAFSLSVASPGGTPSPPVSLATGVRNGACTVLGSGLVLGAGETLRLDLTASVDPALDQRHGMLGTVGFRLRGVLVETAAADQVRPGSTCQPTTTPVDPLDPDHERLPNTGSAALLPLGLLAGAAIAVGIGLSLVAWRRREPEESGVAGERR